MFQNILVYTEKKEFLSELELLTNGIGYHFRTIKAVEEIKTIEGFDPAVFVVDFSGDKTFLKNITDELWKKFKTTKTIVVYNQRLPFAIEEMGTRRLSLAFVQRPFETETLIDLFLEFAPLSVPANKINLLHLSPVRISDISAGEKFSFDLFYYMPNNNKCLLYRKAQSIMTQKEIKRFESYQIHDLYVRKTDLQAFSNFAAKRLKTSFKSHNVPDTERRTLIRKRVKDLFGDFFDSGSVNPIRNKTILNTCKQVVGQLILDISPKPKIFEQILQYTAQLRGNYSHSLNVSVYSCLFGMVLGNEDVENAAIGGMLHDIGLSALPETILNKPYSEMTPEEQNIYRTHPEEGRKLLASKNIAVSSEVLAIIEQHHEYADGTGYPKGLRGEDRHILARVCQIADEFDELTSIKTGKQVMAPKDALAHILENNNPSGTGERFDKVLLEQLQAVFTTPESHVIDFEKAKERFGKPVENPRGKEVDVDVKRRKRYQKPGA